MQRIFRHYCSFGQKSNTTRLGISNFSRLIVKDAKVVKRKKLTTSDVELVFMKSRRKLQDGVLESHLHYPDFVRALTTI